MDHQNSARKRRRNYTKNSGKLNRNQGKKCQVTVPVSGAVTVNSRKANWTPVIVQILLAVTVWPILAVEAQETSYRRFEPVPNRFREARAAGRRHQGKNFKTDIHRVTNEESAFLSIFHCFRPKKVDFLSAPFWWPYHRITGLV